MKFYQLAAELEKQNIGPISPTAKIFSTHFIRYENFKSSGKPKKL